MSTAPRIYRNGSENRNGVRRSRPEHSRKEEIGLERNELRKLSKKMRSERKPEIGRPIIQNPEGFKLTPKNQSCCDDLQDAVRDTLDKYISKIYPIVETESSVKDDIAINSEILGIIIDSPSSEPRKPVPKMSPPSAFDTALSREHENTLKLIYTSVKHFTSLISPLSSPKKYEKSSVPEKPKITIKSHPENTLQNKEITSRSNSFVSSSGYPKSTEKAESEIQNSGINSTFEMPIWISANLTRLQRIKGLNPTLKERIIGQKRKDRVKQYPKPDKRICPSSRNVHRECPPNFPEKTTPSSITKHFPPTPPKTGSDVIVGRPVADSESPVKPDSTNNKTIHAEPDSSTVLTNLRSYKQYFDDGVDLKQRGDEMERTAYLLAFVTYTEAIHHFNMAAYVSDREVDSMIARRDKTLVPEIQNKSHKLLDLILSKNIHLCYKIRTFNNDQRHKLTSDELVVWDRLMIMCYRCEAKLNLILYKYKTSMMEAEKLVKTNQTLIAHVDNTNGERRQSPQSPSCTRRQQSHNYQLSREDWRSIKSHCSIANYIMKAHTRWGQAERLLRTRSHSDFFARIHVIADVPDLKFYESSLKDLSLYQKAVVNKLRDEIQSNIH